MTSAVALETAKIDPKASTVPSSCQWPPEKVGLSTGNVYGMFIAGRLVPMCVCVLWWYTIHISFVVCVCVYVCVL